MRKIFISSWVKQVKLVITIQPSKAQEYWQEFRILKREKVKGASNGDFGGRFPSPIFDHKGYHFSCFNSSHLLLFCLESLPRVLMARGGQKISRIPSGAKYLGVDLLFFLAIWGFALVWFSSHEQFTILLFRSGGSWWPKTTGYFRQLLQ